MKSLIAVFLFLGAVLRVAAAERADKYPPGYVAAEQYVAHRISGPLKIDGRLDDAAWKSAAWTNRFVDIEGDKKPRPRFATRVKMLWDQNYFYIAAVMEEPHVWGTLTKHDSVIFRDNDFEVFIDPDGDNHNYGEFEINALNTGWDLKLVKPYRDGGPAQNSWEIPGLKTAVHVEGTLNDPTDTDKRWTVELAFPWKVLAGLSKRPAPPHDGDQWRINFSRVEWRYKIVDGKYTKIPKLKEDNWVWSPQGVIAMHRPETWGYVQFSTAPPGTVRFRPDLTAIARHLLHGVYYAQKDYRKKHQRWAARLADLKLATTTHRSLAKPLRLQIVGESYFCEAVVRLPQGKSTAIRIHQDSRVEVVE